MKDPNWIGQHEAAAMIGMAAGGSFSRWMDKNGIIGQPRPVRRLYYRPDVEAWVAKHGRRDCRSKAIKQPELPVGVTAGVEIASMLRRIETKLDRLLAEWNGNEAR